MAQFSRRLTTNLCRRQFSCTAKRLDAAYDGPGKTTVDILNESSSKIMIDGFSTTGFLLNNNTRVMGPVIVMPDAILQWNISSVLSVDEKAFVLFDLLHPKPDIVFFGYGCKTREITDSKIQDSKDYLRQRSQMIMRIVLGMKKKGINVEALPTEDAIASYNYLCNEDRLVAAAFIPPEEMTMAPSYDEAMERSLTSKKDTFQLKKTEETLELTPSALMKDFESDVEKLIAWKKESKEGEDDQKK